MKSFLVIDFQDQRWFDQIFGEDWKEALTKTLKLDPQCLGLIPEGIDGVFATWSKETQWTFKDEESFNNYVNFAHKKFMEDIEIDVLDVTDPQNIQKIFE